MFRCGARLVLAAFLLSPLASVESASTRTAFTALESVSLRYQIEGPEDGDTIVLLHEMGMMLESWDDVAPVLAKRHRVLRYDLRGFGLSEKILGAVTIEQEVSDLSQLLDSLGIKGPVTLIGGAVGGAIALKYAATNPQQVHAVVAISPAAGVPATQRGQALASAARIERGGLRPLLDNMEDIYPSSIRTDPDRLAKFRALQLANDPISMAATLRMIATTDFDTVLPAIRCPVLMIAAGLYPARPVEGVRTLAARIPRGRFVLLQTGHFMGLQSPSLLLAEITAFLENIADKK